MTASWSRDQYFPISSIPAEPSYMYSFFLEEKIAQ